MFVSKLRAQFTATADGFKKTVSGLKSQVNTMAKDTTTKSKGMVNGVKGTVSGVHANLVNLANSTNGQVKKMNSGFTTVRDTIVGLGGAYIAFQGLTRGMSGLWNNTIGANMDLENYHVTLKTVLGSEQKAIEMMEWAENFAAKTPFEIPQIVDGTAKLTAYGVEARDVMTEIGDMASVMNKPLDQAIEAFADAQTGELERLKEFGITKNMLADASMEYFGKELVNAKGQITDFDLMNETLLRIMRERYAGGMEDASKTARGMISNIRDAIGTALRELSTGAFEKFRGMLAVIAPTLQAITQLVKGNADKAKEILTDAFGAERANRIMEFFQKAKDGFNTFLDVVRSFQPTWENLMNIVGNIMPIIGAFSAGFIGALIAVATNLQPVIEYVTGLVSKFTEWAGFEPLVYGLVSAFVAFKVAMFAINAPVMLATAYVKAYTIAQKLMNTAMKANPVAIIIALIVGLGVALYTAYQKSETFRNIVDSIWEALKNAWSVAFEWLTNFFTVTIPAWWAQVQAFFEGAWLAVQQGFKNFVDGFLNLWNNIIETVKAIVKPFVDAIVQYYTNLYNNVMYIIEPLIKFFKNTFENIKLVVMGIISVFMGLFLGDMEAIKLGALAIWEGFKRQYENLITNIKEFALRYIQVMKDGTIKIFTNLKDGAIRIGTAMKDGFVNGVIALKDGAINRFNNMKDGATNSVRNMKDAVVNGFTEAKNNAINRVTEMYNQIVTWFNNTKTKATGMKDDLIRTFKNIDLKQIGKDIISGLLSGIAGKAQDLYRKATEIADGIKNKIKKALDINSPSKVMEDEVGEETGAGIILGMDNMRKKVYATAQRLAGAMRDGVSGAMGNAVSGQASITNNTVLRHIIDLANVPSHIDQNALKTLLVRLFEDREVQSALDIANEEIVSRQRRPNGGRSYA